MTTEKLRLPATDNNRKKLIEEEIEFIYSSVSKEYILDSCNIGQLKELFPVKSVEMLPQDNLNQGWRGAVCPVYTLTSGHKFTGSPETDYVVGDYLGRGFHELQ